VVIAGMSGAGRTQAGNALEDLGWFVIDNLPSELIPRLAELVVGPRSQQPRVALVVRTPASPDGIAQALDDLRASGAQVRVVFLDASTEVLVRRYESTKRRHPTPVVESLSSAIESERAALHGVRERADLVIDTSTLSNHDLRARVIEEFSDENGGDTMRIAVMSFGFKYGIPADVDLVLDCRFLANPYWNETLRPLSGLDEPVKEFLNAQPMTKEFLDRIEDLLGLLIPAYRAEGKAYLTIAMGCTGGRHRSVAIAEALGERLRAEGISLVVKHRDERK
jgi:UPF0042 nucleotide-binding protein